VARYLFSPPLIPGRLIRRHKRFLAEVELETGQLVTAHTPNTGRMIGCSTPGSRVYLSEADNPKRKLKYTLEIVRAGSVLVGVNTLVPNRLIRDAIAAGEIPELRGYDSIRSEVAYGEASRIDLLLEKRGTRCYVEIKNVTLGDRGVARFPDAVTKRGRKHLVELARVVRSRQRGVVLFLVQRADCRRMAPADEIDPEYGRTLREVMAAGVEALAYRARVTSRSIRLDRRLRIILAAAMV
jgi:sugar fermentation stimulation protein A